MPTEGCGPERCGSRFFSIATRSCPLSAAFPPPGRLHTPPGPAPEFVVEHLRVTMRGRILRTFASFDLAPSLAPGSMRLCTLTHLSHHEETHSLSIECPPERP